MEDNRFISASVVTYNDGDTAQNVCRAITENTKRYPFKLYVIDNASFDGTVDSLSGMELTLIRNIKNIGFGAAHNVSLEHELGKYHFIVNPDIEFTSDLLSDITDFMEENPDIALCMPNVLNPDGTVQYLPKEIPTFKRIFLGRFSESVRDEYTRRDMPLDTVSDINFCSGSFMCIKTEVFKSLGGFDKKYFMYLEDADLTLKAQKYGRTVIAPQFTVTHKWQRESAKKLKYLLIHTASAIKFLWFWRGKRK